MKLAEHERETREFLRKAGIDGPEISARLLTAHAAGLDKIAYILAWDQEFPPAQANILNNLARRRANGEPLAYILGSKEFYGRDFIVSKDTLIPRPETELLVDSALTAMNEKNITFADLGCGTGCIGITLLKERPCWQGILLENNPEALDIAIKNAELHNCAPHFVAGDFFYSPLKQNTLDLIISNPPYIGIAEKDDVMRETLAYEPHCALFSPQNGLAHLQAVIQLAHNALKPAGQIILEHGSTQGIAIGEILKDTGFVEIRDIKDLAGLPRCTLAKKQEI